MTNVVVAIASETPPWHAHWSWHDSVWMVWQAARAKLSRQQKMAEIRGHLNLAVGLTLGTRTDT